MNEFSAKKLGEVLAFSEVGIETFEKGKPALSKVLGSNFVDETISQFKAHSELIKKIAKNAKGEDVVLKKLESTGKKLRAMRDLYVGEEWDNPTELLEWSGFFEGAAIVHWSLVKGVGETIKDSDLTRLCNEAPSIHQVIFDKANFQLNIVGKEKSK